MTNKTRPTKKQTELLRFIEQFIAEKGYGPSYREIMAGCNYSSVATVAVHVNNLVANGHLIKKDRSARSLEMANGNSGGNKELNDIKPSQEKWLVEQIENKFYKAEKGQLTPEQLDNLYVLVGALKILGINEAARLFIQRLNVLKSNL
ncbi:hypothetical protein KY385_00105 [Candidatus Parcubacteria bacterium]|nr:hypothetical protein [Candidatus Parcubacteria bacterium]